jgi:hypothetical protein
MPVVPRRDHGVEDGRVDKTAGEAARADDCVGEVPQQRAGRHGAPRVGIESAELAVGREARERRMNFLRSRPAEFQPVARNARVRVGGP